MKTLICKEPGALQYGTMEMPGYQLGRSIIKIKRIGICGTDLHAFEGTQPYFSYPRILGHELAGELVETDLPDFRIGEPVTFIPYYNCENCVACKAGKPNCCVNIAVAGVHTDGGMTEYLSVPSRLLVHGDGLGFEELALIEPLAIGAHGIRRAGIAHGEFVLVIGAGPIGLGTMEFAKIAGARVIAMDINTQRLEFCKAVLDIPYAVDGLSDDIAGQLKSITNGDMPTVVIDATGNLKAINHAFQYLAHGGRYVLVGLQKDNITFSHPEFHKREATLMSSRNATRTDFENVISALKQEKISPTTYITHRTHFDEVATEFKNWLNPANGVIKAMVYLD